MEREVSAGVHFLKRIALERGKLDEAKAEAFAEKLHQHLCDKYNGHWYKNCPSKGQAYRCIQINSGVVCDDVLLKACRESHLTTSQLGLPRELTLWIDPLEVCARSGENCRPFTVARFEEEPGVAGRGGLEDPKGEGQEAGGLDTSDYHSATSSSGSSLPANLQYFYQPAPAWPRYKKAAPVFLTPVCTPPLPQLFRYYFVPQPSPHFLVPQAPLQPIVAR
ncbi:hypothetical protein NHX12_001735 [Muraenolepis orangiensis]|uniref:Anti-proliferative protein domain-containing protein n=1 Tax=Muraenolepis orangiensis TaxID=630683 RepID=A0A9Q0IGT1_9TELE|nr:hypothetical protein NHX12_001735 [Muraenolepis orangiensis]